MGAALITVAALIAVGFALDQLFLWLERRAWLRWRKTTSSSGSATAGIFGEMQNLFSPSSRHTAEEIRSKQMLRDHSMTADGIVDLDSGIAHLHRRHEPT